MAFDPEEKTECERSTVLPVWKFIESQLIKMDRNYQNRIVERNRKNGLKGGRPKNQLVKETQGNPKNPMGYKETQKTLKISKEKISKEKGNDQKELLNGKIPFQDFWEAYDKKAGKQKAEKAFNRLSGKDHEAIMQHIPLYKKAQPDKKYRKNPLTYLNQRAWEDELIFGDQEKSNHKQQTYSML